MIDGLTFFAWFVMAVLFGIIVWIIVAIGSLPKKIAAKRNHPQIDAINAASWIGLLMGGVGWFIAFVWAFVKSGPVGSEADNATIGQLRDRVAELETQLAAKGAEKE